MFKRINSLIIIVVVVVATLLSCQKEEPLKKVEDVCTKMDDIGFMTFCYDHYDANKDGKVSMEEANAVYAMNIDTEVHSLKGIEYFRQLSKLECIFIGLTSVDVSKNSRLNHLNLQNNRIASLDISALTQWRALTFASVSALTGSPIYYNSLYLLSQRNTTLILTVSKQQQQDMIDNYSQGLETVLRDNNIELIVK